MACFIMPDKVKLSINPSGSLGFFVARGFVALATFPRGTPPGGTREQMQKFGREALSSEGTSAGQM